MSERAHDELLQEFLSDREAACPACRYSLRNCSSDRCPECGAKLQLGLVSADGVAMLWWSAGFAGFAIATFIALLVLMQLLPKVANVLQDPGLMSMAQAGFASTNDVPTWKGLVGLVSPCVLTAVAMLWMLTARRHFSLYPKGAQVTIAVAGAMTPLILFGFIALLARYVV